MVFITLMPLLAAADEPKPVLVDDPQIRISRNHAMLSLTPQQADTVGRQVWQNETGGNRDAITAWNGAENFASLGIGHFIWFPTGLNSPFKESFPTLLKYLQKRGANLPRWLDASPIPPCPWNDRAEFKRHFHQPRMTELREFLLATVGLQAEFLVLRMQAALPDIIASTTDDDEKQHLHQQFNRVANASPDLYPLIDYINFKGEGTSQKEQYPNHQTGQPEGWGLKHVLLEMRGTSGDMSTVLAEFSNAAGQVLKRRVKNNPPNKRWLKGWLVRTKTYRYPLK